MLTGLKEALNMIWARIRRAEGWLYGLSQSPIVIEQGSTFTLGGVGAYCYWKKWSNGLVECWGYTSPKNYSMTSTSGNGYYTSDSILFPTGLFTSIHTIVADRKQGDSSTPSNTLVTINVNQCRIDGFSFWVQTTGSYAQSLAITFYACGTWKTLTNTNTTLNKNYYADDVWNYSFLINKPSINGQTLIGDKSLADFGFTGEIANDKIGYTTTTPTEANIDGLKFVVLTEEPEAKYDGWFYIITE